MRTYVICNQLLLDNDELISNLKFIYVYKVNDELFKYDFAATSCIRRKEMKKNNHNLVLIINELCEEQKLILALKGYYLTEINYKDCSSWLQGNITYEEIRI